MPNTVFNQAQHTAVYSFAVKLADATIGHSILRNSDSRVLQREVRSTSALLQHLLRSKL